MCYSYDDRQVCNVSLRSKQYAISENKKKRKVEIYSIYINKHVI